ncbi:hypothetical protein ACN263_18385 [Micromonospora sp. WMMD729]|uniref:hypothetical protein n=1 Tax=Micromonospora sp. WMMD729 TaxID=3404127 RepID=UPI003BF5F133
MNAADEAENRRVALIRELAAGGLGVVATSFLAVVLFPAEEPVGRVLVMATACGLLATSLRDWRAALVTATIAEGVFLTVLTDGAPPAPAPLGFTPVFVVAVVLGVGNRHLRLLARGDEAHRRR